MIILKYTFRGFKYRAKDIAIPNLRFSYLLSAFYFLLSTCPFLLQNKTANREGFRVQSVARLKPAKQFLLSAFYFLLSTCPFLLSTCPFLLSTFHLSAQDSIRISGVFEGNTRYAKVLVKKFGIGSYDIAGATIYKDSFTVTAPATIESGVYRFQYAHSEQIQYIDLILNGQDRNIRFSIKANDEVAKPVFTGSVENIAYQDYLQRIKFLLGKIDLLNQFIYAYPSPKTEVVRAALAEYEKEKLAYSLALEDFKSKMKGTWAYHMVANRPYYFTNPTDDPRIQDYMKREHYWEGMDVSNVKLINSPLYTEHILNYLRYWMNPKMNFNSAEKTEGFKRDVDRIIRQFSTNKEMHEFAYRYLTLGFKEIGEEEVLKYMDENYKTLAEQCMDNVEKSEFDRRMKGYAALKEGNLAPNIVYSDAKGVKQELHKLKSPQTMIVFWASTCPHCLEEIPKVNLWAKNNPQTKVLAISLDGDAVAYKKAIVDLPDIIHSCDFKRWDGAAVNDYFIFGTPTYILLDRDKKIISKSSSFSLYNNSY